MKVLLVGATGAIGRALLPVLIGEGHEVFGTSRSAHGAQDVTARGAHGVVLDIYDDVAVRRVLGEIGPDALISQVTDLPDDPEQLASARAGNARVRRQAVPRLVAAATELGVRRILVQSVAWRLTGEGADAVAAMEQATLDAGGVVIRYGQFYGAGTFHQTAPPGPAVALPMAAERTAPLLAAQAGVVTVTD